MSDLDEFLRELSATDDTTIVDFARRKVLHGTPVVFMGREDDYYAFRKRIADFAGAQFLDVFITGSAKLGFSPIKRKPFDLDSDIDVTIVSANHFERVLDLVGEFQMEIRRNRLVVSKRELDTYHRFLEYTTLGWMRPDLLPTSFKIGPLKSDWFDFFSSISHGESEVGNYKVSAGVFKSHAHFERYTISGLSELANSLRLE
ncbi:hypothetical protein H1235_01985 [Pseudoxanthomonas sp. NC8]|nr:hypothetical protein H1235_01985 [Pseudoxanthomonas sp. NC8]